MKKRFVSFLLAMALLMGLLPNIKALAANADPASQVHVIVENTTFAQEDGAAWEGVLVDLWVDMGQDTTMMNAVVAALEAEGYSQTGAENNYISEINGLSEFDGGSMSGWMGTLNDWFTNEGFGAFTVANGTLQAGDEIHIMYTKSYGEDLGGSWGNNSKTLKDLSCSVGTLSPAFLTDTHSYTLTVPADTSSVRVTPTAANKNFQVRMKTSGEYLRFGAQTLDIADGTVITVTCGDESWPSMNNQAGGTSGSVSGETYTITVAKEAPANTAPQRVRSVPAETAAKVYVNDAYTLELATIFEDADADALQYKVKIGDAAYTQVSAENGVFSYTPNTAGTTTLVFMANDGKDDSIDTYTVTLNVQKAYSAQFVTQPANAAVALYDANGTLLPTINNVYSDLIEGQTYSWTVSCNGYLPQSGTLNDSTALTDGKMTVNLTQAPPSSLTNVDAVWPNFRGSFTNNGITASPTPTSAQTSELLWAKKLGTGWSAAPSVQLIVDNTLVTMVGSGIYKLDLKTGDVLAQGTMAAAINWGYTPPTYAEGMIFCPLSNGTVQAFNAETLESLWVYKDVLKGQALSPITYCDGSIYTGFWNSESKNAAYVCLSVTDEDPTQSNETKTATWRDVTPGGFYWAGSVAVGDFIIYGTDNGVSDYVSAGSHLVCRNKNSGQLVCSLELAGDQRSTITYDSGKLYFTTKNGYFWRADLNKETGEITNLVSRNYAELGTQSTSTPVVYKGVVYFALGGGVNASGCFAAVNAQTLDLIWSVKESAYPQCSALLSTAYEADGFLYFYLTYNGQPGGIDVIKVPTTGADNDTVEKSSLYDAAGYSQYCISSIICNVDGTLYYKNDSGNVLAVGHKKSDANAITGFVLGGISGTIDEDAHTITVLLPMGTDVTNLKPEITISEKATITPRSGVAQDFTNPVVYTVQAENGAQQTYTVTIQVDPASDATLSALQLDGGSLSPAFAADVLSYAAAVANDVTRVTVSAQATSTAATVSINGQSGAQSIALAVGTNRVNVLVTAQSGISRTYAITITRAASSDASLSALSIDNGDLSPAFAADTLAYHAAVTNAVSAIHVTATATDADATVTVNGNAAAEPVSLQAGENEITVLVRAADGKTTRTYTVVVTRAASSDASLSALGLSSGSLSPNFDSQTLSYTASVDTAVEQLTLTPVATDTAAVCTVNGKAATKPVPLQIGENVITVAVTAQDGKSNVTYTVVVTRAQAETIQYTITSSATVGGHISPDGSVGVKQGESQSFTIAPDSGYEIADVTVDGQSVGAVSSYELDDVQANHTIVASFVQKAQTPTFTDVAPGSWYEEAVRFISQTQLMTGTAENQFNPSGKMTRAMLVTVLYRLDKEPETMAINPFADVPNGKWYTNAIIWAKQNNIANGISSSWFNPNGDVTRQQIAAILMRYAAYKNYNTEARADLSGYTDADQMASWAKTAMQWANAQGLIAGRNATTLAPTETATRAEVATILMRFCNAYLS